LNIVLYSNKINKLNYMIRFQRKEYAQVEVFQTEKKGYGLRTLTPLKP